MTRRTLHPALAALPLLVALLYGCKGEAPAPAASASASAAASAQPPPEQEVTVDSETLGLYSPLPTKFDSTDNPSTPEKVDLGRMLFFETRLSKNQDLSCNSCHNLNTYGVDGRALSTGHRGQQGDRSSPTVYNTGAHIAQFWDGRAKNLEEQAKGPILNPTEMAMRSEKQVKAVLKSIPGYVEAFAKAFPGEKDPVSVDNLGKAIGAFERQLVTPARFDKFLEGDKTALTNLEKTGMKAFASVGCTMCHNGPALGGGSFQKLGLAKPFDTKDLGRFNVTKAEADKQVFRVPSLRNIEKTAPYMHDGSMTTLEEMVRLMAKHQLGKQPTEPEVVAIVAFLKSLTGVPPADYIKKPDLPPSGPNTPKPDPH